MLASLAWLGEYVELGDLAPEEVANRLTMAGLEVEDIKDRFAFLQTVVVGQVTRIKDFGGALRLLEVSAGDKGKFQVLCGDPLVDMGLAYPLALVGTELPAGPIKERIISGVASQGMLVSEYEIGLSTDASRVMPIDKIAPGAAPGTPLSEILKKSDLVLDISVTPNRADALSIMGIARDLAAILGRPLGEPKYNLKESDKSAFDQISVAIEDPEHCIRYTGRVINGASPGPSPDYVVARLLSAGLRPINNIVDVTNYCMLEIGLPLHAFDLAKIAGPKIIVKVYPAGRMFTTLDGQPRILKADRNIMICDELRAVGIGGVMGGQNTEVDESTTDVFLEAASFNQATIRRTSRSLGLSTDASYRFERGLDPNLCHLAVDRAAAMIAELTGGSVAKGRLDAYPITVRPKTVNFSVKKCNALLGTDHGEPEVERVLTAIGVGLTVTGQGLYEASLPTFRPDLTREVDLFEEVSRLLDFENLPTTLPKPPAPASPPPASYRLREKLRTVLCGAGLCEAVTFSFVNRVFTDQMDLPKDHPWRTGLVPVLNPLSEDHGVLRPSLLPGLLSALRLNQYHSQRDAAIFELGTAFIADPKGGKPLEGQRLAAVLAGDLGSGQWNEAKRPVDFWDAKGLLELVADELGVPIAFSSESGSLPAWGDPTQSASVSLAGRPVGHLGLLSAKAGEKLGLKEAGGRVYAFEIDIDDLPPEKTTVFKLWSNYPGVTRDMAVVLDRDVPASEVLAALSADPALPLARATIFDLYQGEGIPPDKKSLAMRLFFQESTRTLTDEEVNGYFNGIVLSLKKLFSAELRG
ncbi:MAG: phenylalanine--tRNA ligase subunit beta [Deltaproteobacteria bacterium]|jgi:phenylalanyl-tRNA synthetase beta chain|nr:phenylalanine--tRNA ligase subunit beta [Deltaproteobacteria bacterium]